MMNRAFALLWAGQMVSLSGSQISGSALALMAVLVLHATPLQMGLLGAAGMLPVLLVGPWAGVWVDRLPRRSIMIAADLCRALLLFSIPLAALLHSMSIEQIYVVVALVGMCNIFFEAAYRSFLPAIVPSQKLVEANSKLAATASLAEIGGPSLGGVLVQVVTAPYAILLDALSYLWSAIVLGCIRVENGKDATALLEQTAEEDVRRGMWFEIRDGMLVLWRNPVLRALLPAAVTSHFFMGAFATLYALYTVRELHVSPVQYGLLVTMGGIGALAGTFLAGRVVKRWGQGRVLIGGMLVTGGMALGVPLAAFLPALALVLLLFTQLVGDSAASIYAVAEMSLRQATVPQRYQGRAHATWQMLTEGMVPLGGLITGLLAGYIGMQSLLFLGAMGIVCSTLWLLCSPVRSLHSVEKQS